MIASMRSFAPPASGKRTMAVQKTRCAPRAPAQPAFKKLSSRNEVSCKAAAVAAGFSAAEELLRVLSACTADSLCGGITQQSRVPVVVLFTATSCTTCQDMAEQLAELKEMWGDEVRILQINVEEHPELAERFNVSTLPTTMFIGRASSSRPAISLVGAKPFRLLDDLLDSKMHVAGSCLASAIQLN
eukprot:gene18813-25358_t